MQKYLDTLHPTLEVGHTSKGLLTHHQVTFHLSDTDLKAPDVMEHYLWFFTLMDVTYSSQLKVMYPKMKINNDVR